MIEILDVYERAEMESQAKYQYDAQIDAMRRSGDYNTREVKEYERSIIIQKSIDNIRDRADYLQFVRSSPKRYDHVESKVARCLKVQKKVNRRTR